MQCSKSRRAIQLPSRPNPPAGGDVASHPPVSAHGHGGGNHEKEMWYKRGLMQPPRLMRGVDAQNLDYETEREQSWSEVFCDLIFVVGLARLGEGLREEALSLSDYILVATTLYQLWNDFGG